MSETFVVDVGFKDVTERLVVTTECQIDKHLIVEDGLTNGPSIAAFVVENPCKSNEWCDVEPFVRKRTVEFVMRCDPG